jgi:iron complex outermembrane receptor protein
LKVAGVKTSDNQDGNRFIYHENIRTIYSSLSKNYGKWGVQFGLRAEQTSAKGIADPVSGIQQVKPDTSYLNLLPGLYLTFALDEKSNFRLSFSRRIRRPDYDDLQPITYQLDPLDYKTGNPALRTQRNNNAELSYTFDNRISLAASYTHAADYFNEVIQQVGNVLYQTTGNAGKMNKLNFDLNYPIKVNKWWTMLNKVNIADDHFKGQQFQGYLDQEKWRCQVSTNQRFSLPGKYLLQLGARYTSASQNLIYRLQSSANTNASISRKLFNDQASVKIGVSDIFKTQRNYTSVNFGSLNYTDLGTFESRRVSFSFSWRIGNQKVRKTAERERGDADEKSRSGN